MLDSYLDPVASLRSTLDEMFDTIAARGRTKSRVMAYLLNVDVVSHLGGLDQAVGVLVEIDRRIRDFKADQRRRFQFTLFADHGNAHKRSQLVDPVRHPDRCRRDVRRRAVAAARGGRRRTPADRSRPSRRPRARELRRAARGPAHVVEIAARTSRQPVRRPGGRAPGGRRRRHAAVRHLAARRPLPLQPGRRGHHRRR